MTVRASDVKFTIRSGDRNGETYGFTLADNNGQKGWSCARRFHEPPSMIKEEITLLITAREQNVAMSGATELKIIGKIIESLEIIATETEPIEMVGLDGVKRLVLFDRKGYTVNPVIREIDKEPEYVITVPLWSLYISEEEEE